MAVTRKTRTNRSKQLPKETKSAQRSRLELFARGLTDFPDPVVVADNQSRIVFVNQSAWELFAREADQTNFPDFDPVLPDELLQQFSSIIDFCLSGHKINRERLGLRLDAEKLVDLTITGQVIRDQERQTIGCLLVLRDLRADLMAQPEIIGQITLLGSILKNFPTPFFFVDNNLVITEMNPSLEMLTGYSRQEVIGRMTCAELLGTNLCKTPNCLLLQAMQNGSACLRVSSSNG